MLFVYDDGYLHDSGLSLYDDGYLHDSGATTDIDDDHVDSDTVGSFCTMSQGERYISKVKALEAGKAAKRRQDEKEKERRLNKEAFKMERERVKKEKEREMELNRKIKQEEMNKREADMAARKKQREKDERAKKRKEEKRMMRILLRNKCAPDWVELNKEIRAGVAEWRLSLKKAWDHKENGDGSKWIEYFEILINNYPLSGYGASMRERQCSHWYIKPVLELLEIIQFRSPMKHSEADGNPSTYEKGLRLIDLNAFHWQK
ncbi:hypothetical protein L2E82_38249 [Cichorium intybus]|uniref:Uncharacterized protein n=1 Tax=Cichorium intybus TaxID=13427 RepID=A0ACB9AGM3_CICIN|nr:hypothetical protein L2E82_38249 [Cichorium intybus]